MLQLLAAAVRPHRRRLAVAVGTAVLAGIPGCGGSGPAANLPDGGDGEVAAPQPRSPLTGLPMDRKPRHGIYVVKVENTAEAEPQIGLRSADLIVEEMVEGGVTRLAAFYHSKIPPVVGPVRSMRASDIGIVKPARAVLVASGAAPQTYRRLDRANVRQATQAKDPGYYRPADRPPAPYNLMLRLPKLVKAVRSPQPPATYLPFGPAEDLPQGRKVRSMEAVFPWHTTTWRHEPGRGWRRTNSLAAPGDDFVADNVLVLRVKVVHAGYHDAGGYPVPETVLSGRGDAVLLHGDRAVTARWSKRSLQAPLQLSTSAGPLRLPPGRTFIELVPAKDGDVVLRS